MIWRFGSAFCTSGLFDIWAPEAPFNNLKGKDYPLVLLLRIFEIAEDLTGRVKSGQYADRVPEIDVHLVRPIIPSTARDRAAAGYRGAYCFGEIITRTRRAIGIIVKPRCRYATRRISNRLAGTVTRVCAEAPTLPTTIGEGSMSSVPLIRRGGSCLAGAYRPVAANTDRVPAILGMRVRRRRAIWATY